MARPVVGPPRQQRRFRGSRDRRCARSGQARGAGPCRNGGDASRGSTAGTHKEPLAPQRRCVASGALQTKCQWIIASLKDVLKEATAKPARKSRKSTASARKPRKTTDLARKGPDADEAARKKREAEEEGTRSAKPTRRFARSARLRKRRARSVRPRRRHARNARPKRAARKTLAAGKAARTSSKAAPSRRKSVRAAEPVQEPAEVSTKVEEAAHNASGTKNHVPIVPRAEDVAQEPHKAAEPEPESHEAEQSAPASDESVASTQKAPEGDEAARFSLEAEELSSWSTVDGRGDVQLVRDHMARFPGGVTEGFALTYLEYLKWTSFGPKPTATQLKGFIREFPDGDMADIARSKLAATVAKDGSKVEHNKKELHKEYFHINMTTESIVVKVNKMLQKAPIRMIIYSTVLTIIFFISYFVSYAFFDSITTTSKTIKLWEKIYYAVIIGIVLNFSTTLSILVILDIIRFRKLNYEKVINYVKKYLIMIILRACNMLLITCIVAILTQSIYSIYIKQYNLSWLVKTSIFVCVFYCTETMIFISAHYALIALDNLKKRLNIVFKNNINSENTTIKRMTRRKIRNGN